MSVPFFQHKLMYPLFMWNYDSLVGFGYKDDVLVFGYILIGAVVIVIVLFSNIFFLFGLNDFHVLFRYYADEEFTQEAKVTIL